LLALDKERKNYGNRVTKSKRNQQNCKHLLPFTISNGKLQPRPRSFKLSRRIYNLNYQILAVKTQNTLINWQTPKLLPIHHETNSLGSLIKI
jgi:hypothetical protein